MTSIPAPYAASADPAARRWWDGLSDDSRRELERSWCDDDRDDPLLPVARRVASYLNAYVSQSEPAVRKRKRIGSYAKAIEMRGREPAIYWSFSSAGIGPYRLFDHGMFWPVHLQAGRWEIRRNWLSAEQHDLLSRQEASG
ncbi:hypothetical protein ACI2IY_19470 [Lysobacter enzymogenes]|uniref:hypothetical protein n=1 Tax=Lysobacter enzymogenes TaxID=69 RepID=UPI00384DC37E